MGDPLISPNHFRMLEILFKHLISSVESCTIIRFGNQHVTYIMNHENQTKSIILLILLVLCAAASTDVNHWEMFSIQFSGKTITLIILFLDRTVFVQPIMKTIK